MVAAKVQITSIMTIPSKIRRWLLSTALALPAILAPSESSFSIVSTHYAVGWPLSGIDLQIYPDRDGLVHFQYFLSVLLPVSAAWIAVIRLLWNARRWAINRLDWYGAFLQALFVSGYCGLLFYFCYGTVNFGWHVYLEPMKWPALIKALQLGRQSIPFLYGSGLASIGILLYLDAHRRCHSQRYFHIVGFLCFVAGYWYFAPFMRWQLRNMDEEISIAQKSIWEGR